LSTFSEQVTVQDAGDTAEKKIISLPSWNYILREKKYKMKIQRNIRKI
jgi:hypothetical protein